MTAGLGLRFPTQPFGHVRMCLRQRTRLGARRPGAVWRARESAYAPLTHPPDKTMHQAYRPLPLPPPPAPAFPQSNPFASCPGHHPHIAGTHQLIDSEVGADCSAFVPPSPPAANGSSSSAPSTATPPPSSSQSAPLVGRPPPPAPPKRRFQEGMVDEVRQGREGGP